MADGEAGGAEGRVVKGERMEKDLEGGVALTQFLEEIIRKHVIRLLLMFLSPLKNLFDHYFGI